MIYIEAAAKTWKPGDVAQIARECGSIEAGTKVKLVEHTGTCDKWHVETIIGGHQWAIYSRDLTSEQNSKESEQEVGKQARHASLQDKQSCFAEPEPLYCNARVPVLTSCQHKPRQTCDSRKCPRVVQ